MSWTDAIGSSRLAGVGMPAADQAFHPALWAQQVRQSFFPLDVTVDADTPFTAQSRLAGYAQCRMAQVAAGRHVASMSQANCDDLGQRYVKILWELDGAGWLEQAGQGVCLQPGHFTIYEASRPYSIQMEAGSAFVVLLCEVAPRGSTLNPDFRPFSESAFSTGAGLKAMIAKVLWWHVCNSHLQT